MPAETPASAATWRRLTASRPRSAATRIRASAIRARRARWSTLFGTRPVFHNAVALTPVEAHRYIAVVLKKRPAHPPADGPPTTGGDHAGHPRPALRPPAPDRPAAGLRRAAPDLPRRPGADPGGRPRLAGHLLRRGRAGAHRRALRGHPAHRARPRQRDPVPGRRAARPAAAAGRPGVHPAPDRRAPPRH